MEMYGQTPSECLDFASVAPTPELAISMRTRLPSSLVVFVVRRAALLRQLWDGSSSADSPGVQVLVLIAHMLGCLASLFATQMALPPDGGDDDNDDETSALRERLDAAPFYAALRCQNDALVAPLVHALLTGFVEFSSITTTATTTSTTSTDTTTATTTTTTTTNEPTSIPALGNEQALESGMSRENDRELSWYPNLFSVRPVSLGEAVVDVGRSLLNVVAFPVRLVFQGARAVFYTHRIGDIEVILPTAMADAFRRRDPTGSTVAAALSDVFAALLVALVHPTASRGHTPFRAALCALADSHFAAPPPAPSSSLAFAQTDYPALFAALSAPTTALTHAPLRTLLLYFLLEGNRGFREYVYARPDCETLLLPLLHQLYLHTPVCPPQSGDEGEEDGDEGEESASTSSAATTSSASEGQRDESQHEYAVLLTTILHILSEDAAFARGIHAVQLTGGVPWYTEAYLPRTTLGGLLVLVLVRLLAGNLRYARDPFLHTSCVATLSNLAPHFVDLPPLPASRLVKFVGVIHRRCCFLKTASSSSSKDKEEEEEEDDSSAALTTYRGFLRAQLLIVLNALRCGLERNPNIVYALLQEQSVFAALAADPDYAELAQPLCAIAAYFAAPPPAASTDTDAASAPAPAEMPLTDVLRTVVQRAPACRTALALTPAAPEAYDYAEDAQGAWHFFEALAWRAVVGARAVPFSPTLVRLFPVPGVRNAPSLSRNSDDVV